MTLSVVINDTAEPLMMNQGTETPHPGIEPKMRRVQLSSLQRRAEDSELGMQLCTACQLCQVSLSSLFLLQGGIAMTSNTGALHSPPEVLFGHRPLTTASRP